VYVGSQSGVYSQSFDVGNTNSFVFDGAAAGQRYYFAVAAYAGLLVSELSIEVSGEATGTANSAPYLLSPGNQTTVVGQAVSLQLVGGDSQGDPVTYSATGLPPGLTVGQTSGLVVGVPMTAGSYPVTAKVSDGTLTAQRAFTWSIVQATTAPTSSPTSSISSPTSSTTTASIDGDGVRAIRQTTTSSTYYTGTAAVRRPVDGSTTDASRTYTGTTAIARTGGTTGGTATSTRATATGTTALTRTASPATGSTVTPTFPYTGTTAVRSVTTAPEPSADPGAYTSTFEPAPYTAPQTGTTTAGTTTTTGTTVLTAPGVRIQTPTEGSLLAAGTPVILAGVAEDVEDGTLSTRIVWSSSVDGPLGTGALVYRTLSPGVHVITALVSDSHGNVRMARVTVTVR
jgi:hypothetical protein